MTEYKNIIIVETNEAGQPTNLRRLEDGDTISNERLNADVRNAANKIDTVETTANNALTEAEAVSSTVYINSGTWGTGGGIDATTLANLVDVSSEFAGFSGTSGVLATCSTVTGARIADNTVSGGQIADNTVSAGQIAPTTITNSEISTGADIDISKLQDVNGPVILGKNTTGAGNITTISKTDAKAFVDVDDLEASSNFPVTTLNNALNADGNEITGLTAIKGTTTSVLTLSGKEPLLIGTNDIKIGFGTPGYPNLSSLTTIISDLAAASATPAPVGGGSAVASAIAVGNGSSVIVSGADDPSIVVEDPQNGGVMIIDTAAARIKFRKINATNIDPAAGITGSQLEANTIGASQLATGAASGNIIIGGLALNKLTPITAGNFLGNPNSLGAPVESVGKSDARRMLGLSAGTVAPPSPDEGDLWYNTTTDVDELFAYDSGRGKWLGVNSFCINAGRTGTIGSDVGHYAIMDNREMNPAVGTKRGFQVPFDCTVVGWAWSAGTDTSGFQHRLAKYDDSAGTTTQNVHTYSPAGTYDNWEQLDLDIDYDQRDIIGYSAIVASSPTGTIVNQNLTIVIKRRTS